MTAELLSAVPIIPARDIGATAEWYRDQLGFAIHHVEREYGIVGRDDVFIHFWGPSGIEPAASMTMLRIGVAKIQQLYQHCLAAGIVHPNATLERKEWGCDEFGITDYDGNLVTFFEFPDGPEGGPR